MIFDHPAVPLCTATGHIANIQISEKDKIILRALGAKVAELANRPIEEEKKKLWYAHNDLVPVRPLVFCDPEVGWSEIIPDDSIRCKGELAQTWEMSLRKEIFWGEYLKDDKVIEPNFNVPYSAFISDWGLPVTKIGGQNKGAYTWVSPLKDFQDIDRLRNPQITVDYDKTNQMLEQAEEIFRDLLKVRIKGFWWWTLGLAWTMIDLRGLQQSMFDMHDDPGGLHRLMAFIRDGTLNELDFLEQNGLLSLNTEGAYVGSGGFGWTRQLPLKEVDGSHVGTKDMWGFGESQEVSGVSPKMFEEFVFQYQLPILSRFGLVCYGCCEPLNARWEIIKKIPNLRRVSVAPWADVRDMAEKLQDRYIFSLKPHPGYLAVSPIDEDFIRKGLREALKITRANHCHVEIIMKDNHTLANRPENAIRWCQIALEEATARG